VEKLPEGFLVCFGVSELNMGGTGDVLPIVGGVVDSWKFLIECGLSEASWDVGVLDSSELPHPFLRGRYGMVDPSEACREACVLNGRRNHGGSSLDITSVSISIDYFEYEYFESELSGLNLSSLGKLKEE
jgi:hypothetical protein